MFMVKAKNKKLSQLNSNEICMDIDKYNLQQSFWNQPF